MKKVEIHTDGACRGNPGPGGYGVVMVSGKHRLELSQGYRRTTNNRMELLAGVVALESLKSPCRVKFVSDSLYVINAMKKGWLRGWKARGWLTASKQAVKNEELWKRLDAAAAPHQVEWAWIRGHAGHQENERCDELAVAAAQSSGLLVDTGFEQPEEDRLL
ncbi:ribonuclease HI [Haloferula sp.]|uniref:ribonuclease HI n=1 Tax=Haloferula sp. TaxID=2497595 RepID=UPI00329FA792